MARLPRLAIPGCAHVVLQVGHGGAAFARDDAECLHYLAGLREAARLHALAVHAYAVAGPRAALLVTPTHPGALSAALQDVGRRYAAWFNRRAGRHGAVWDGRFRAAPVDGAWTLRALRWVEFEPVRAGLADQPADWRHASTSHHLGQLADALVTDPAAYWALGNTPFERHAAWRRWLEEGVAPAEAETLESAANKGWALGDLAHLAEQAEAAGVPVRRMTPRRPGRPRLQPGTDPADQGR